MTDALFPATSPSRRVARLAAAAFTAMLVQGVATRAHAQSFLTDITSSLGLTSTEAPDIEYRERAPLVIPPAMTMRAPQASIDERQAKNWPQDPDILDRKRRAADRDAPVSIVGNTKVDTTTSRLGGVVRPDEQHAQGRMPGGEVPRAPGESNYWAGGTTPANTRDSNNGYWIPPSELSKQGGPLEQKQVRLAPGVEPERRYLTEPPKGARLPSDKAAIKATRDGPDTRDLNEPNARQFVLDQNKR